MTHTHAHARTRTNHARAHTHRTYHARAHAIDARTYHARAHAIDAMHTHPAHTTHATLQHAIDAMHHGGRRRRASCTGLPQVTMGSAPVKLALVEAQDCVMGPWTEWTECIDGHPFSWRRRKEIQRPNRSVAKAEGRGGCTFPIRKCWSWVSLSWRAARSVGTRGGARACGCGCGEASSIKAQPPPAATVPAPCNLAILVTRWGKGWVDQEAVPPEKRMPYCAKAEQARPCEGPNGKCPAGYVVTSP